MSLDNLMSGRFQRNADGQFVGSITIAGIEERCWLIFDEKTGDTSGDFLRLTFEEPKL